uniref:Potassium channel domain-containing protein n=1 Tax=Wuchereria bancrofti TaxID=6293 RepID=A0AAF5PTH8_WUCBA
MAPLRCSAAFRQSIRQFQQSIQERANTAANVIRQEAEVNIRRIRHAPRWIQFLSKVYHEYGLKHILLIIVLIIYQFIGAAIFYFCEASHDKLLETFWKENVRRNRTRLIDVIVSSMLNNTEYLFFFTSNQTRQIKRRLDQELTLYEKGLGIKYTDQKIRWDFWNAMLYAQTICTTIGYGYLYPSTTAGRIFTMLYAIVGIPLVLSILDDLGELLTKCLKTPWYLTKCGCRRLSRYCTKQTMTEIWELDAEDKRDLEIFDLPIPIVISVVITWIFIYWDYFVAFYFFFISLSTIGLGDITPTQPKYLLMLFIYIVIGLSLLSMCINLIQSEMARTYEVGQLDNLSINSADLSSESMNQRICNKNCIGSGNGSNIINGSARSLSDNSLWSILINNRKKFDKSSQTMLSFLSPRGNSNMYKCDYNIEIKFLPRNLSDDAMKLVDTEEDILVLTGLIRDDNNVSDNSDNSSQVCEASKIKVSKNDLVVITNF